ncbi:IclR family transcriptional regulator [Tamaricihabitans halophyticus]|uniref:IclR family transcriptional regulator n=1 Tax=Tamaricihabitans halophyticus TaxID=1262583 RepID=A0A4R2QX47_9PSEU|nr:IclR family transcriptional regulator [Tamaricihabitans halophyticus]TCP53548.1 IclR family transcriptional regulator [Tamaricihabitans halophyticus]
MGVDADRYQVDERGQLARRSASWNIVHAVESGSDPQGAQSIQRAFTLLNLVAVMARDRPGGVSLAELARTSGRPKASVHRMLMALSQAGYVAQDADTSCYRLGFQATVLGELAGQSADRFGTAATDSLIRLSDLSADTTFLTVRHGSYAVCTRRQEGPGPIRNNALAVGDRHPLGVGAGSLAILSALPDQEIADVLAAHAGIRQRYPRYDDDTLWRLVRRTRADGYALNDGLFVPGSWAMGVVVRDTADQPVAALSIASIEQRLGEQRRAELALDLQREAAFTESNVAKVGMARVPAERSKDD